MFDIFFGWRKATTCKKLIRHVQCRLKILKNRRESIIRHLEDDIAEFIKKGEDHKAFARAGQLIRDQKIKDVYDLLDNFGEFIIIQLPYIRKHKDCPNDINEAVSSLLFASARFGDLPELKDLRKLFGKRYGNKFAMAAVELLPGNLVNQQVIEKLCMQSVSDDVKFRVLKEIARQNNLQLRSPDVDCMFLLQYSQEDSLWSGDNHQRDNQTQLKSSSDRGNVSIRCTAIQPSSKIISPLSCQMDDKGILSLEKKDAFEVSDEASPDRFSCQIIPTSFSLGRPQKGTEVTSDCLSPILERTILYLDDIEEFQPIIKEDDDKMEEQRFFLFKLTTQPLKQNCKQSSLKSYHLSHTMEEAKICETLDEKTSCRRDSKKSKKSAKKNLDRKNVSMTSRVKKVEDTPYFRDGKDSARRCHRRKHHSKRSAKNEQSFSSSFGREELLMPCPRKETCFEEIGESSLSHKCIYDRRMMYSSRDFSHDMASDCCLKHPCYFSISYIDGELGSLGSPSSRQINWIRRFLEVLSRNCQEEKFKDHCHYGSSLCNEPSSPAAFTHLRNCERVTNKAECDNGRKPRQEDKSMTFEEVDLSDCPAIFSSSCGSSKPIPSAQRLSFASSTTQQLNHLSNGSSSCSHVHPKLPDYDELVSKFRAIKIEHVQCSSGEVSNSHGRS